MSERTPMPCQKCGGKTIVLDSRQTDGGILHRRRRECTICKARFTTYETIHGTGHQLSELVAVANAVRHLSQRFDEMVARHTAEAQESAEPAEVV